MGGNERGRKADSSCPAGAPGQPPRPHLGKYPAVVFFFSFSSLRASPPSPPSPSQPLAATPSRTPFPAVVLGPLGLGGRLPRPRLALLLLRGLGSPRYPWELSKLRVEALRRGGEEEYSLGRETRGCNFCGVVCVWLRQKGGRPSVTYGTGIF